VKQDLAARSRPQLALLSGRLGAELFSRFCSKLDCGWGCLASTIWRNRCRNLASKKKLIVSLAPCVGTHRLAGWKMTSQAAAAVVTERRRDNKLNWPWRRKQYQVWCGPTVTPSVTDCVSAWMALNSHQRADVPLRNYSLTHACVEGVLQRRLFFFLSQ